jgi:hypothetical protein
MEGQVRKLRECKFFTFTSCGTCLRAQPNCGTCLLVQPNCIKITFAFNVFVKALPE